MRPQIPQATPEQWAAFTKRQMIRTFVQWEIQRALEKLRA